MASQVRGMIALIFIAVVSGQIYPISYEVNPQAISENGSSATGHCSNVSDSGRVCNTPRTSVLFDGIPTLPGLDGDMWASQLLTLNKSRITLNFTTAINSNGDIVTYVGVETVEIVMFNCPFRGIGATGITLLSEGTSIGSISRIPQSCEYLVSACLDNQFSSTSRVITLSFDNPLQFVYLAEVRFYSSFSRLCPPDGIINGSVLAPTSTPTLLSSSGATRSMNSGSDDPNSQSFSENSTGRSTIMITTSLVNPPKLSFYYYIIISVTVIILVLMVIAAVVGIVACRLCWKKRNQSVHDYDVPDFNIKLSAVSNSKAVKDEPYYSVGGSQYENNGINDPEPNPYLTPAVNNQVITPEYEDVDMSTKTTSSRKSIEQANVLHYEDVDNVNFNANNDSSSNDKYSYDSSAVKRQGFDDKSTRSTKQTSDASDCAYSHLESNAKEERGLRTDTVLDVYTEVHKPPKKPESHITVDKTEEESILSEVAENSGIMSNNEVSLDDNLTSLKPSPRNTWTNNKEGSKKTSLTLLTAEKTPELENEFKGEDAQSQGGGHYE